MLAIIRYRWSKPLMSWCGESVLILRCHKTHVVQGAMHCVVAIIREYDAPLGLEGYVRPLCLPASDTLRTWRSRFTWAVWTRNYSAVLVHASAELGVYSKHSSLSVTTAARRSKNVVLSLNLSLYPATLSRPFILQFLPPSLRFHLFGHISFHTFTLTISSYVISEYINLFIKSFICYCMIMSHFVNEVNKPHLIVHSFSHSLIDWFIHSFTFISFLPFTVFLLISAPSACNIKI